MCSGEWGVIAPQAARLLEKLRAHGEDSALLAMRVLHESPTSVLCMCQGSNGRCRRGNASLNLT